MNSRRVFLWSSLSVMPAIGLTLVCMRACDTLQPAHDVGKAVWLEDAADPLLLVHETLYRSDDTDSWTVNRLVGLEPATGKVRRQLLLDEQDTQHLWAARGAQFWTVSGDSTHPVWRLRDLDGASQDQEALHQRVPGVRWPWAGVTVSHDGLLLVEADDMKKWSIDPSTFVAEPAEADAYIRWPGPAISGCYGASWTHGGKIYVFVRGTQELHSETDYWELATAASLAYGSPQGTVSVASGFSSPSFACSDRHGIVSFGDDVLVTERQSLSRIGLDGTRRWTYRPEPAVDTLTEAWPFEGGVIARLDRRFVSLGGDGKVRWEITR